MEFEAVYRQYGGLVYAFLLRLCRDPALAEELAQETMFRAILNIGAFRGDSGLATWLCRIARNCYTDHLRRSRRAAPPGPEEARGVPGPEEALADRDTAGRILRLAQALPEPYREVFLLHVLGDVPLQAISHRFGKSDSWARVTYYRAKARIIAQLEEESI